MLEARAASNVLGMRSARRWSCDSMLAHFSFTFCCFAVSVL
jgi:hypothetical protein